MRGQNPRIADEPDTKLPYLCECGDIGCEKCVPLAPREYEKLPAEGRLALSDGHRLGQGGQRDRGDRDGDGHR